MNKFITLTRVLLKNTRQTDKKGKLNKTILLFILLGCSLMPLIIGESYFLMKAYDLMAQINQQGIIIALGISAVCLIIFFFGIFFVINTFYFSKDVESLLPLPLRPSQILGGKFTIVLIYEYLTELIVLLPFIIIYGIKSGGGIAYCIYSILIYLAIPVIPIVLDSLLAIVIMRFTNIGAHKERFKTLGGICALFVGIGFNVFIQRFQRQAMVDGDMIALLQKGNNSFVKIASSIFPGSSLASESLINSNNLQGLGYMLGFLGITALLIVLFLIFGEKLYLKGVVGLSEAPSKRKKLSQEEFVKTTIKSSSIKAYTMKEIRILFRTSVYFMNCVLMNFIWPIAFIPALV